MEAGTGILQFPSMQESTMSLLGALNLPDATESRQSTAGVQLSSAGVSPNMARRSSSSSSSISAFQATDRHTSPSPPVPEIPLSIYMVKGKGRALSSRHCMFLCDFCALLPSSTLLLIHSMDLMGLDV